MKKEFETKVSEIDPSDIISKLEELGAEKIGDYFMKRWVLIINENSYDKLDKNSQPNIKWIRLRDNGEKVTLTYKHKFGDNIGEVYEVDTKVEDFDATYEILSQNTYSRTAYQENKRIVYRYDDVEYCIDTWPLIPTYLEIEASSLEKVKEGVNILGLNGKDRGDISVTRLYAENGMDLEDYTDLRF